MTDGLEAKIAALEAENANLRSVIAQLTGLPDSKRNQRAVSMLSIAQEVAIINGLTVDVLLRKVRAHSISHPRQDAMRAMIESGYSYSQVGRFFGKDHTTVLHGVRRSRERQPEQSSNH